jgi:hypothetical protein
LPAAPSWPWRRGALILAAAAQLITISALNSADPLPVTWSSLLLAIAPALLAAVAAFAPARSARLAGLQHCGIAQWSSPCILGPDGLAVLDLAAPRAATGDSGAHPLLELAARGYGPAEQEVVRLAELVTAWDGAKRPGADRLRIGAYPAGTSRPENAAAAHPARHATFVVSLV